MLNVYVNFKRKPKYVKNLKKKNSAYLKQYIISKRNGNSTI